MSDKRIDAARDAERKRCVDILQLARFGEIDQDWRSVISMIESGWTVEQIKAGNSEGSRA